MTDKEIVIDVKHRLNCYQFYTKQVIGWQLETEARETKINGVASGSPKKLPEGNSDDEDWRSPLFDEIAELERRISANKLILDQIETFIAKLEEGDKIIFDKLYLQVNKRSQRDVGVQHGYTRRGLQDRIDRLITEYWEY